MGAGASMEETPPSYNGGRTTRPPSGRSRSASARGLSRQNSARYDSARGRPRSAVSAGSKRSARSSSWKDAVRSATLQRSDSRKERASALGRKSACVIELTKSGFSYQHVQICEGQVVTFEWETDEGSGLNITQVMHDGDQYRPVIGGFNSGAVSRFGFFEQQFNLDGEYKFVSSGLRCTPLTIEVYARKDVEVTLSDEGFSPKIVRIDEGNTVEWSWKNCSVAHSIFEMRYSHKLGALVNKKSVADSRAVLTKSGSFRREFNKPGLYYFQSEGGHSGEVHSAVVHVRERQQEYKVEVLDRSFNPPIVVIEEGDRIWWQWDKVKSSKPHCIYQINPPPLNHPVDESYKPVKNGFKWPQPSPCGLLSHEFFTPGVYYFSDHNFNEAAEYLGTIIVKPKQVEHFVELSPEGFTPDLLYVATGDRIWWTWAVEEVDSAFNVLELEKCVSPVGSRLAIEASDENDQGAYMDDDIEHTKVETGLESVQLSSIGVYHYRVSDSPHNMSTCTVIAQGGARNHTVHVTDQGFDPKVVTIHPNDRIWWIWQDGAKQHNIIQVSHQGSHIIHGFKSGAPIDCPSAFMHQFRTPGVYYYIDDALAKSYGAIVVASQPQVHEIQVTANSIVRDPCVITVNDVVAWTFQGLRQSDVQQAYNIEGLTQAQANSSAVLPRKCMNRVFTDKGVFHFSSKSFLRQNTRSDKTELRISTVLTDEVADSAMVRLDSKGFHPNNITIRKGQSVLWTWKESGDQAHNIVNVNPPNSDAPLSVIQGGRSFNSGKPVAKNSFLYTFDDPGEHCVASQGAPGHAGTVTVLDKAVRTGTPYITSTVKSGLVQKSHKIHITCDTDRAKIFYTLDGSTPEMHKLTSKSSRYYELSYIKKHLPEVTEVYNPEKGIKLRSPGIVIVRAIAVREGILNSEVFTSHRYIVQGDDDGHKSDEPIEEPQDEAQKQAMWHWWNCVPSIKAVITEPGAMEVFWEHPQVESRDYIKGYNLFLNGVTYCEMFPPTYNAVNVAGLAGDRMYEIYLEVYPNDPMYLPHKSNKVVMKIPKNHVTGGPLLSLETTEKPDTLAIVWMSIDSEHCPIEGYRVYLNGQMCGNQVVPDANSDRCKVVIEGCQLRFLYKVMVTAIPKTGGTPKQSNELHVNLPLDKDSISLPHAESRLDDDDLYKEYLEIREGSGDPVPLVLQEKEEAVPQQQHVQIVKAPVAAPEPQPETVHHQHHNNAPQLAKANQEHSHGTELENQDEGEARNRPQYLNSVYEVSEQIDEGKEHQSGDNINNEDEDSHFDEEEGSLTEKGNHSENKNPNSFSTLLKSFRNEMADYSSYRDESDNEERNSNYGQDQNKGTNVVKADPSWKYPEPKPLKKSSNISIEDENNTPVSGEHFQSGLLQQAERVHTFRAENIGNSQNDSNEFHPYSLEQVDEMPAILEQSFDNEYDSDQSNDVYTTAGHLQPPSVRHNTPPRKDYRNYMNSHSNNNQDDSKSFNLYQQQPQVGSHVSFKQFEHGLLQSSSTSELAYSGGFLHHSNSILPQLVPNGSHSLPSHHSKPQMLSSYSRTSLGGGSMKGFSQNAFPNQASSEFNHFSVDPEHQDRNDTNNQTNYQASGSELKLKSGQFENASNNSIHIPSSGHMAHANQSQGDIGIFKPPTLNISNQSQEYHARVINPTSNIQLSRESSNWDKASKGISMLKYVKHLKPKLHSVSISAPGPPSRNSNDYYPPIEVTRPPAPHYIEPYKNPQLFPHKNESQNYQDHNALLLPSSNQNGDDEGNTGFIDATLGPWRNKMRQAGESIRAIKHIQKGVEEAAHIAPDSGIENMSTSGYEIEVQSEEEVVPPRARYGKKKRERKKSPKPVTVEVQAHVEHAPEPEVIEEVAVVPVIGAFEGDKNLPAPVVTAESLGSDDVKISWYFKRSAEPLYRLMVCEVHIVGPKFKQGVNSDMSFESLQEQEGDGQAVPAVQHRWNVTDTGTIRATGLWPGMDYSIYVVANYALVNAQQPYEIQAKSSPITYSTMGPPNAPLLKVVSTDLYQVTLGWEPGSVHKDVNISGFRVLIDGNQLGGVLSPNTRQSVLDNLAPGKSIKVQVQSMTSSSLGNSDLSNPITVVCPSKPPPPSISQQPSYKKGTVTLAWERPHGFEHAAYGEDIHFYRIYLDGVWHGEVKACAHCNRNGYQYLLTELSPGQTYDVTVKSYAGQQKIDPTSENVYCICESDMSHAMAVMCPAPPESPQLRLEGMDADGIDVTWNMPQQFGDAQVSGYQMMKNGKLYGSIIPPEVHTLRIRGLSLGEKIVLQILALTDHPVGRDPNNTDSGSSSHNGIPSEIFNGDRYSSCTPGPKLAIVYTGLVQMPVKVWCEQITGHSAMIVWQSEKKARPHYVFPDNYQVTWWPGDKPDQDINSQQTKEDHLLITGLKPRTTYNIVVEARKVQKYGEMHGDSGDREYSHTFILTAQTDKIVVKTASPPGAPSNIGILATTCSSIQVGWDSPKERGADVIGMRVDAVPVKNTNNNKHTCIELMADATSAVVDGLSEKSEYLMVVTAITEEYFDQLPPGHEQRRSRQIPKHKSVPDDAWLPSVSILASTSGTTPPTDLRIIKTTVDSVTLTWKPPHTYGSNRLQGTIVRWAEGKFTKSKDDGQLAHHRSIEAESNKVTIDGLHPGILYKVVVEGVVSVKTTLKSNLRDPDGEKMNRRTTHVMSKPVFVRTRAPCEPPKPIITGYTPNTIQLYWEKPLLYSVIGKDDVGNPKYLKLSLEGYRLEINGKPHMRLVSNAQSCTLVKCKSGKKYKIVLVALTCTEEVKKERRRKGKGSLNNSLNSDTMSQSTVGGKDVSKEWEMTSEDLENDESPSKAIEVMLPGIMDGVVSEASVAYISAANELLNGNHLGKDDDSDDGRDLGDLQLDWKVQHGESIIKNFNLTWYCHADGSVQKKVVDSDVRTCMIPVQHRRCLYDVTVEGNYHKETSYSKNVQKVQSIIPGSPNPPEIWTRSVTNTEFVIEWAEPRLYGIKIKGYQVYMNGKKVGNMLNSHHRKAVIPCKPRRQYKVNLVAIPNDAHYADSDMSNTLLIHTGGQSIEPSSLVVTEEISQTIRAYEGDNDDLPVKVIKVSESSIHLDWSNYTEVDSMSHYKVLWSSVAQPAEKEVKLPAGERSCVIHKCYPGTNHYIRIYACALDERILDKSRQVQAQTSASPDTPALHVRACNFKYIAIQWEQPKHYGDASVIGYKVFVNGVVEAVLGPDQFTYTFSQGKWCKEYSFQVQAQTSHDTLNSRPSDPLVVTWPGVQSPCLNKGPSLSGGNAVRIIWETPEATEGVKIKQYKLVCLDEETMRPAQIISPIHADATEAELQNLKHGNYVVYLEVHIHGTNDVVKSDNIKIKPALTPDPPYITVTVIGLEERRQIEKVTTCLINQRDRYLSILNNEENQKVSPGRYNEEDQVMKKAAESLAQVEERLDECFSSLNHYTGHLLAHVSWTCAQSNPDVRVTGYKVLVDGKQYGTTLHAGVKNIRIKLGLNQPSHHLSMISVCDRPQTTSCESNAVELLTEPFLPFTYYSFLTQDPQGKGFGPSYQEALALERKQKNHRVVSQGLIKKKVPPPACTLYDIFQGAYHPLFPPSGPRHPTAILFWAKWCYSSRKTLEWFVKYARNHSSQFEFVAISCTPENMSPSDSQDLVQVITQNAWREDTCIRHMTSRSANEITLKPAKDCYWNHGLFPSSVNMIEVEGKRVMHIGMSPFNPDSILHETGSAHDGLKSTDMCEIFGIQGVPTLLIVHPEDYVAWKGRYCAFDYQQYEHFLDYVFAQSLRRPVPSVDPWDATIDLDDLEGASKHRQGDSSHLIHRPSSALHRQNSTSSTTVHMNGTGGRPQSGKRLFTKSNKNITVDMRPYSASLTYKTPYAQKVTPSPKRGKSAKKAKSTF